jgi:hypothetical protein
VDSLRGKPSGALTAMAEALDDTFSASGAYEADMTVPRAVIDALAARGWTLARTSVPGAPNALGYGADEAHAAAVQHNSI